MPEIHPSLYRTLSICDLPPKRIFVLKQPYRQLYLLHIVHLEDNEQILSSFELVPCLHEGFSSIKVLPTHGSKVSTSLRESIHTRRRRRNRCSSRRRDVCWARIVSLAYRYLLNQPGISMPSGRLRSPDMLKRKNRKDSKQRIKR